MISIYKQLMFIIGTGLLTYWLLENIVNTLAFMGIVIILTLPFVSVRRVRYMLDINQTVNLLTSDTYWLDLPKCRLYLKNRKETLETLKRALVN